jgi:hypothetical protein
MKHRVYYSRQSIFILLNQGLYSNTFSVLYYIGVWFLHCHLEVHTTWGLKMAFLVDNGKGPKQSLIPPPKDLPKC